MNEKPKVASSTHTLKEGSKNISMPMLKLKWLRFCEVVSARHFAVALSGMKCNDVVGSKNNLQFVCGFNSGQCQCSIYL